MELVSYDFKLQASEPFYVIPVGDIQWSGKRGPTASETLRSVIERGMELGAWFLGMGDYIDFLSPSNRQRLRGAALYDTAEDVIDDKALELTMELYETHLKPTKGRWLGLLEGHHFTQLKTGDTTDMRLCQMLDTKFLGTSAYIRLQFRQQTERHSLIVWAHHGAGGGSKAAAPVQKLENIAPYWDADVFVMGHMTKQAMASINRISSRWNGNGSPDLIHRKIMLVGAGGFSKGYVEHARQGQVPRGGYVEQRLLNPAALGAPTIKILWKSWSHGQARYVPMITVEA